VVHDSPSAPRCGDQGPELTEHPDELFGVANRVVVVTGGLGQLGRQFARTLVTRGARVAILDSAPLGAGEAKPLFGEAASERVLLLRSDITDPRSLEAALGEIEARWETPSGLVNNAALDSPPDAPAGENGPFETYPKASWDRVMNVNVTGTFLCCQVIGGAMAAAGRGSVVQICSIYGLVSPDQRIYAYREVRGEAFYKPVAYSVSKSSLLNLTRYLATYWAPRGVRVNTLSLGGVFRDQDEPFLGGYCARVPLGRMAREDEYNGALLFLLSDASSYMTGSNLVIDGGWTAW
jgi:NAD(P)-dependent dehydrogenase (short-subunit alcohol dehydrogenase family)